FEFRFSSFDFRFSIFESRRPATRRHMRTSYEWARLSVKERMPMNSTSAFLKSAFTLVLASGCCGLILFPSARAQEGVAGDNPLVSKPKQEPPADTQSSKEESRIRV